MLYTIIEVEREKNKYIYIRKLLLLEFKLKQEIDIRNEKNIYIIKTTYH